MSGSTDMLRGLFLAGTAWLGFASLGTAAPDSAVAPAPESAAQPRREPPPVPATFRHPGLLTSLEELQRVKARIEAGQEPWKSAFETLKASKWAKLNYQPKPREVVSSGFTGAGGGTGGAFDQNDDAIAAYSQALMWIFTGDERHAEKAVEILNAWSILQSHEGPNWYMIAQWTGSMFPLGAELIRATYPGWKPEDIARFSEMLNRAYLPILHNRLSYGNRHFGVINALMAIGVFNNDRAAFAEGMRRWVSYVPNWIYLKEDGPEPIPPDYWLTAPSNEELAQLNADLFPDPATSWIFAEESVREMMKEKRLGDDRTLLVKYDAHRYWNRAPQSAFVDGLCAETFRDLGHCDLGLAQMTNAAEIAWHQGVDLYSIHAKRIAAFLEFNAFLRMGDPLPKEFYRVQSLGMNATFEIAYNHLHNRMGLELPNTKALIEQGVRPSLAKTPVTSPGWSYVDPEPGIRASQIAYPAVLAIAWETLTHADLDRPAAPSSAP